MRAGTIRGETAETITRLLGLPGNPTGWRHKVVMDFDEDRIGINVSTREAFARLTIYPKDPKICLSIVDKPNNTHTFKCFATGNPLFVYDQEWDARTGHVGPKRHFDLANPDREALAFMQVAHAAMNLAIPHMRVR